MIVGKSLVVNYKIEPWQRCIALTRPCMERVFLVSRINRVKFQSRTKMCDEKLEYIFDILIINKVEHLIVRNMKEKFKTFFFLSSNNFLIRITFETMENYYIFLNSIYQRRKKS